MHKFIFLMLLFLFGLMNAACQPSTGENEVSTVESATSQSSSGTMQMGMRDNMMARHHATIPEAYAGLSNPIAADEESLAKGAEIYATHCVTCHGDGGMGDGPASETLNPAPAPIARTSQMMGDDYQFWRISEGGAMEPFNSGMIAWKGILDEQERWDVINYVQALGRGTVAPGKQMGGAAFDPLAEAVRQEKMLDEAVAQGVINEQEAAVFAAAHEIVDTEMIQRREAGSQGSMDAIMLEIVEEMVANGELSRSEADTFLSVHDRLGEAGLMN